MIVLLRAFWLLLLIGCSSSYAGLFQDDEARRQISAQQTSLGNLRNQVQMLEARIVKMEEALNNQPLLELNNQIEALRLELNKLQGQIEVLANENELTQKRQKDFYVDLDSRLRRIEQPAESAASGASSASSATLPDDTPESDVVAPASAAAVVSPMASDGPAEIGESRDYEAAYNLFKLARYQDAISQFKKFLKTYPESGFVPSAHYWIGNSYYALRDFQNAISTQEKLINAYPDSGKVPDAMLNLASSQQEMNKKAAAKKTLENLIAKYPGSDAAEKAKRRLANKK